MTPLELVYGQEAVLPIEVNLAALRFAKQTNLSAKNYYDLMMDNIEEVADKRLMALKDIVAEKLRVPKTYNKKVRLKDFQVGDLVWKLILPIVSRSRKFGKWSPSLEGPLRVARIVSGNSYLMETMEGSMLPRAINGRYLKKFHPSVWQSAKMNKTIDMKISLLPKTWPMSLSITLRLTIYIIIFWHARSAGKQGGMC